MRHALAVNEIGGGRGEDKEMVRRRDIDREEESNRGGRGEEQEGQRSKW